MGVEEVTEEQKHPRRDRRKSRDEDFSGLNHLGGGS